MQTGNMERLRGFLDSEISYGRDQWNLLLLALRHISSTHTFPDSETSKHNSMLTMLRSRIVHHVHSRRIKTRVCGSHSFYLYCSDKATVTLCSFTLMRKHTCSLAFPPFHRNTSRYQTIQLDKIIILQIKFLSKTIYSDVLILFLTRCMHLY